MSGIGRNTSSKWDSKDEPEFSSYGTAKLNPRIGFSNEESISGGRGSNKDDTVNKDYRVSDAQDTDGSNKMEMSPIHEDFKNKHSQSPKTGCSRSRSRSRSRSPRPSFGRDSRTNDSYGMRARGLPPACRHFAAGHCRRGSQCRFLHCDNKKFDDSRVSSHSQDGSLLYSAPLESWDYCRPSGRSKGTCFNSAKGWCRMGASCKYMHHENSNMFNKASMDESTGRCIGSSFEHGGRDGRIQRSDIPCKYYGCGSCRYGKYCRFSHDRQACGSPNRGFKDDLLRSSGGDEALDRPKLSDEVSLHGKIMVDGGGLDGSMAGVDNKEGIMVGPEPGFNTLPVGDEEGHSLDKNKVQGESPFSSDVKDAKNDSSNIHTSRSVGADIRPGNEKTSPNCKYGAKSPIHIKEEHEQSKQQVAPEQVFHQNVNVSHSSSCQEVGQSEVAPSIVPTSVRTIEGVQKQEVFTEKKYTAEANIMDANLSQVGSSNPPTQDMLTEGQLARLAGLSSLMYMLGARQQLPQLSAASVSSDAKDPSLQSKTEGSGKPVSMTFTKPGPAVRFPKLRDPRRDIREATNVNAKEVVPTISPSKNIPEDSVSGQHFDESKKSAFSEEQLVKSEHSIELQKGENVEDNNENNKVVAEGKPRESKITEQDGHLENLDQIRGPEEAKTIKNVKGIHAFKIALVEFVKGLLNPTWKCGKIKKEDYKAIVKKVTDKVTGTVQPSHIPQTKEQIDRYLSSSKPKLDKLVQAYVEKVQKA